MNQMLNISTIGRIFYGTGIAGIGLLHFFFKGFRPLLAPLQPIETESIQVLIYVLAVYLIVSGLLIVAGKSIRIVAGLLALVLLLFFLLGHLPNRLRYSPEILGAWTDAIKVLAISGGAFILSNTDNSTKNRLFLPLQIAAQVGSYCFAFMLVVFGIDHFLYTSFVNTLVPAWIPMPGFWTYFTGFALLASGIAIAFKFWIYMVALLLAFMLFLWLILLHIPYSFIHTVNGGNDIISSFVCLTFCGIALLVAAQSANTAIIYQKEI